MLLLALKPLSDKDRMGWEGVVVGGKERKSASSQRSAGFVCYTVRGITYLP